MVYKKLEGTPIVETQEQVTIDSIDIYSGLVCSLLYGVQVEIQSKVVLKHILQDL